MIRHSAVDQNSGKPGVCVAVRVRPFPSDIPDDKKKSSLSWGRPDKVTLAIPLPDNRCSVTTSAFDHVYFECDTAEADETHARLQASSSRVRGTATPRDRSLSLRADVWKEHASQGSAESVLNGTYPPHSSMKNDTAAAVASSPQEIVYQGIGEPITAALWTGYNATLMAYGATGSGKTHSLFGPPVSGGSTTGRRPPPRDVTGNVPSMRSEDVTGNVPSMRSEDVGLLYRIVYDLFRLMDASSSSCTDLSASSTAPNSENAREGSSVTLSVMEVLHESVFDLLDGRKPLQVRGVGVAESSGSGGAGGPSRVGTARCPSFHCPQVKRSIVDSAADFAAQLSDALRGRTVASTNRNLFSSRAHVIIDVTIQSSLRLITSQSGSLSPRHRVDGLANGHQHDGRIDALLGSAPPSFARLTVVDLAGSENASAIATPSTATVTPPASARSATPRGAGRSELHGDLLSPRGSTTPRGESGEFSRVAASISHTAVSAVATMRDCSHINRSLLALGHCVASIAAGKPSSALRDSVLTKLLATTLAGHSLCTVLVCLSPVDPFQNRHSLLFANRAKNLRSHAVVNTLPTDQDVIVANKRAKEFERLYRELCTKFSIEKEQLEARERAQELEAARLSLMLEHMASGEQSDIIPSTGVADDLALRLQVVEKELRAARAALVCTGQAASSAHYPFPPHKGGSVPATPRDNVIAQSDVSLQGFRQDQTSSDTVSQDGSTLGGVGTSLSTFSATPSVSQFALYAACGACSCCLAKRQGPVMCDASISPMVLSAALPSATRPPTPSLPVAPAREMKSIGVQVVCKQRPLPRVSTISASAHRTDTAADAAVKSSEEDKRATALRPQVPSRGVAVKPVLQRREVRIKTPSVGPETVSAPPSVGTSSTARVRSSSAVSPSSLRSSSVATLKESLSLRLMPTRSTGNWISKLQ